MFGQVPSYIYTVRKRVTPPPSQPWYMQLLQTGAAIYDKYQVIKDVAKQRKAMEELAKVAPVAVVTPPTPAPPVSVISPPVSEIPVSYILIGGIGLVAIIMLTKK